MGDDFFVKVFCACCKSMIDWGKKGERWQLELGKRTREAWLLASVCVMHIFWEDGLSFEVIEELCLKLRISSVSYNSITGQSGR